MSTHHDLLWKGLNSSAHYCRAWPLSSQIVQKESIVYWISRIISTWLFLSNLMRCQKYLPVLLLHTHRQKRYTQKCYILFSMYENYHILVFWSLNSRTPSKTDHDKSVWSWKSGDQFHYAKYELHLFYLDPLYLFVHFYDWGDFNAWNNEMIITFEQPVWLT